MELPGGEVNGTLTAPLLLDVDCLKRVEDGTVNSHGSTFSSPKSPAHMIRHEAVFGVNPAPFESLDYEVWESAVYKGDWRSRTRLERLQYVTLKWGFVLLIGISMGLVAFGINMAVENYAGLKFFVVLKFMNQEQLWVACLVYAAFNVAAVFLAAVLCTFVSPSAAGSGIPEVKAYLNGVDTPDILLPKTLLVKILGSIGSVGGGLAVGKEGPLVHTGACIAAFLGQGGSARYYGLNCRWLSFFKNDRDRRDLVTCGAAAGVAAAFRAPVGGVLFALEEVTSWWRSPLLWRVFFTTAVVAVTLRTVMAACAGGRCGLFSDAGFIIFDKSEVHTNYGLLELLPVVVLGVVGGLLGSLFNRLNVLISVLRRKTINKKGPWAKVAEACLIALVTSVLQYSIPFLAACRPCPDPVAHPGVHCPTHGRVGNYKAFYCPDGHYNDLAGLLFNTNDDSIRNLFSTGTFSEFRVASLLIFLASFYSLAIVTYGIAVPSGLFVPAIVCGAAYGRLVGMAMTALAGVARVDEGTYALLGSASFLGGSMRMTVSLCIILVELTGNLQELPLIMLVLLVAKTVGDALNDGIYDQHVKLKQIPFLDPYPEQFMKHLTSLDAVSGPPVCFAGVEPVGHIYDVLASTTHNAFPVIDSPPPWAAGGGGGGGEPVLYGLVLRTHLLTLLAAKKDFQAEARCRVAGDDAAAHPLNGHSSRDFGKAGSGKGPRLRDVRLSAGERALFLDLHPFANTSPYAVPEGMSLDKVYTLFRQLGLRHLCVVPRAPKGTPVLGIITRHDLLKDNLLGRHPRFYEGFRSLERRASGIPS